MVRCKIRESLGYAGRDQKATGPDKPVQSIQWLGSNPFIATSASGPTAVVRITHGAPGYLEPTNYPIA